MNTDCIVSRKGYRAEDLSERNQDIVGWLRYLQKEFEETDAVDIADLGCSRYDGSSTIGKMITEVQERYKEVVEDWLRITINEIQISLAESEGEGC